MDSSVKIRYTPLIIVSLYVMLAHQTVAFAEPQVKPLTSLDCVIQPSEIIDVSASVTGLIESIHFDRSDYVTKGDKLVQLEADVEIADLSLSSNQAATDTAIELRRAALTLGYKTKERNQTLMNDALVATQEIDKLDTDIRIAELNLRLEEEKKIQATLALQRSQAILTKRSITSPITGVVVERYKSIGERTNNDPIMRIAQLDPLHVEVIVPVEQLGQIDLGMVGEVMPNIIGSDSHSATVSRIDKVMDAASGTFGVRLTMPNPDYSITAGVLCQLDFVGEQ